MPTSKTITTRSTLPSSVSNTQTPWTTHLTIDILLKVLANTVFNPFIAWIIVLCLRAQVTPSSDPAWILAIGYAVILTLMFIAQSVNSRIAHGRARIVDPEHEVVLVTGGASGLGLVIAQMYGMKGGSVAVLDIKDVAQDECEEVFGVGIKYYRGDVGDRAVLQSVKEQIESELGTPTIIINCAAARIHGQPLMDLTAEAFEKTIRTNLLAAFHLYQVFLPGIMTRAENGGTIVTVSSVLGQLSPAGVCDYSASKAGLSALHRTMAAELRNQEKIKTLLVETGQMATPLFDWVRTPSHFFAPVLQPVDVARQIVAAVDSGRGGVLRMPTFTKLVNWYAVLPAAVQCAARYLSGIDRAVSLGLAGRSVSSGSGDTHRGLKKAN